MRSFSPKEKIERAIQARGITVSDLAEALGIKQRSLQNLIRGSAQSRSTQQRLTNFLQTKIWLGIEVTERIVNLPAGAMIILPNDESTRRFVEEAGATTVCSVSANVVKLQCATELHFRLVDKTNHFPPSSESLTPEQN